MFRDKKQLVKRVKERLKSKRIYIMGIGDKAISFASEHLDEINIAGFLTDVKSCAEKIIVKNIKLDVNHIDDFELADDEFIIIATQRKEYSDVFLSSHGYAAFNDFIWSEWYNIFMLDQKVILFEGNCQLDMVYYFLKAVKPVKDNYAMMVYHTHLYKSCYAKLRWNYYLVMCDYFISNNHMLNIPTTHRLSELPVGCRVIKAPRVFFDVFWPEVQKNRLSTYTYNDLRINDKSNLRKKPHGPFDVGDRFINDMIRSGATDDEIINALSLYRINNGVDINERMKAFFDDLERQEKECDLVFSPYLKDNIFKKKCFYDPIHMKTDMNWYVAEQIVKILGLPKISDNDIENYDGFWMYLDHCTEVPVYPEVARQLQLEWVNVNTEYNVTFYDEMRKMTFEEYCRSYAKAARLSMELMKSI